MEYPDIIKNKYDICRYVKKLTTQETTSYHNVIN